MVETDDRRGPDEIDDVFVGQLMSSGTYSVPPDTLVEEAAEKLLDNRIGSLLVVDADDRLRGILTTTDFVQIVAESEPKAETTVERYMTDEVITAGASDPIHQAADTLITYDIHHLPVVDEEHRPIGMLSTTDLTAYVSELR